MITLRQLRYFTSLARHRHFGRAAEDCAVTQPALSMQVRELEREIGTELVERRPDDDRAHRYWPGSGASAPNVFSPPPATSSISLATAMCSAVSSSSASSRRWLLTCCRACCRYCRRTIRDCGWSCAKRRPRCCLKNLSRGELDGVMLALPVEGADVETLKLFEDPFLLAVPAADRTAEARRIECRRISISAD